MGKKKSKICFFLLNIVILVWDMPPMMGNLIELFHIKTILNIFTKGGYVPIGGYVEQIKREKQMFNLDFSKYCIGLGYVESDMSPYWRVI